MARGSERYLAPIYREIALRNVKFQDLQDSACALGAEQELHERYIAYLEFRYDQTDNPCFAWEAINVSFNRAVNQYILTTVGSSQKFNKLSRKEQADHRLKAETHIRNLNLPLPSWCIGYLTTSASAISIASDRLDFRTLPKDYDSTDYLNTFKDWASQPTLSNQQASERSSTIFGFTRRGWNAFEERQRDRTALNLEQMFEDKISLGMSRNQAYAAITEELHLEDERRVRRAVTRGRELIRQLQSYLEGNVKP